MAKKNALIEKETQSSKVAQKTRAALKVVPAYTTAQFGATANGWAQTSIIRLPSK